LTLKCRSLIAERAWTGAKTTASGVGGAPLGEW
jgi:hypothetical protein